MPSETRVSMEVPASVDGPAMARAAIDEWLAGWGLERMCPDAQLVTSELVANAYLHAVPDRGSFRLEAARSPHGVWISLTDGSASRPIIREPSATAPAGRGMLIIHAIAVSWGVEDHSGGKKVWVELQP